MSDTLARKLIAAKLVSGDRRPGEELAQHMDQALLQEVLGTLAMLELKAMGVTQVKTPPSVPSIDHGLVPADHLNADGHLFLKSARARFGVPGQSLSGSDSHTTAAGSLGILAIGAGGIAGAPCWPIDIGSSANPRDRDFAVVADIVAGQRAAEDVSLDINPSSRQMREALSAEKTLGRLIQAGGRLHQAGRCDTVRSCDLRTQMAEGDTVEADIEGRAVTLRHDVSHRQRDIRMAGGVINWMRDCAEAA